MWNYNIAQEKLFKTLKINDTIYLKDCIFRYTLQNIFRMPYMRLKVRFKEKKIVFKHSDLVQVTKLDL